MNRTLIIRSIAAVSIAIFVATHAAADPFFFSTGNPDGLIGTLSQPASAGLPETETADDFVLTQTTTINQATFTGLIPSVAPLSSIQNVEIELYHVFPVDSGSPSGNVPSRVNSPSDVQFAAFSGSAGTLSATTTIVSPSFSVLNTVVTGILSPPPPLTPFTGGEGPAAGQEVRFNITFTSPVTLPADHYFFRPEVQLADGNFLWLSAPRPIVAPGTPFSPGSTDLQTWIRNTNLAPDWLRVGTDITHQGPFNAAFSLTGTVPEPSTLLFLAAGLGGLLVWSRSRLYGG
jgi:PEP-CTERM motif-containing protein